MTHSINILKDILFPFINFIGFLGILFYFLKKPVIQLFRSRSESLETEIEAATKAYENAKKDFEQAKQKLEGFEQERGEMLKRSNDEIVLLKKNADTTVENLVNSMRVENKQKVDEEVKKAQQHLNKVIAEKVMQLTEELFKKNLSKKQQDALVNDFLNDSLNAPAYRGQSVNDSEERGALRSCSH